MSAVEKQSSFTQIPHVEHAYLGELRFLFLFFYFSLFLRNVLQETIFQVSLLTASSKMIQIWEKRLGKILKYENL